jgi:hypothetical protein
VVSRHLLHQDALRVFLGLARVYGDGFAELDGVAQLPHKDGLLDISWGIVVVIVQSDLSPTDTARMRDRFETGCVKSGGQRGDAIGVLTSPSLRRQCSALLRVYQSH